jgi:hypothetical protein
VILYLGFDYINHYQPKFKTMKNLILSVLAILLFVSIGHSNAVQLHQSEPLVHQSVPLLNQLSELPAQAVAAADQDVHDINVLNIDTIYSIEEGISFEAPDCQGIVNHQNRRIPSIATREASQYIDGTGEQPSEENLRKLDRALLQEMLS